MAGPTQQAREILERALAPYAPSRTQLKKMTTAILDEWRVQRAPTDQGGEVLVMIRLDAETEAATP